MGRGRGNREVSDRDGVPLDQPLGDLAKDQSMLEWDPIGPIAAPDVIHWAPALPKTRSGKIMRRILRKIATDELDTIGDISTLAEPEVVDSLIASKGG